jgi:hypothetical protein
MDQYMIHIEHFMMGIVTMGHFVAALFFLKFWTKTRDRLFLWFSVAFWLLGLNRVAMLVTTLLTEELKEHHLVYWVRFLGYVVILIAILDKNRSK